MPIVRPCRFPGCPQRTADGYCEKHQHLRPQPWGSAHGTRRPNARQRGYTSEWTTRIQPAKLAADPLCEQCKRRGIVKLATEVDHITSLANGGTHDWANLQSLCHACHTAKTSRER